VQGSFLHTLEFVFCMDHAITSKGVPRHYSECRDTIKGFAFSIRFLHGAMQNNKRCYAPFKSVCPFLLLCPKEMDERKGHRCAELVASIFAPLSADCESSAYLVSAYSGRLGLFFAFIFSRADARWRFFNFRRQCRHLFHLRFAVGSGDVSG